MSISRHPAELLFTEQHPLTSSLKMKFHPVEGKTLTISLKAPETFADRNGRLVHTAFNALILDTVMGSCAMGELEKPVPIATVKLTCNHLRQLHVGEEILCRATWDGENRSVAFVSGEIISGDKGELISNAVGTFMIGTAGKPLARKS